MDSVEGARMRPVRLSSPPSSLSPVPRLQANAILQGTREVILVHGTEEYRLKVTSSGKLILTK